MRWYPQLQSGAVTQLPMRRSRQWRSVENRLESGERIAWGDVRGGEIEWDLEYRDLTDGEVQGLVSLFVACKGRFGSFGFIDPTQNLLGGSEDFFRPEWQKGLMTLESGFVDPLGTSRAVRLTNPSAGDQDLQQTLSFPGQVNACFSAYVRSDAATMIQMRRDASLVTESIGTHWTRVMLGGVGDPASGNSTFAIRIGAQKTVDLWGLQVEAQPFASKYKPTVTAQGVYPETHFATDELWVTNTFPGRSACLVKAISRV